MHPLASIISLNFHPGHISHMVANCRQMEELGYEVIYYVDSGFVNYLPQSNQICVYGKNTIPKSSIAIIEFPSLRNLSFIIKSKRQRTKVVYCFHEPLAPLKEYRKAGFSLLYLAKLWAINRVSALTVKWSDAILLPSHKAIRLYEANALYKNKNYYYVPLLYDDECIAENRLTKRSYFSYIGTVAADHSFNEYLRFVEWAITNNHLPNLKFLIATKSQCEIPSLLVNSSRVVVRKGVPLSNEEINNYYASTYAVWNAYTRTTQSGVLAKSFMFGTPAIVLRKNLSEFMEDGKEVVAIDDNTSFEQIENAIARIMNDYTYFSQMARDRFVRTFYYRNHNVHFKEILDSI